MSSLMGYMYLGAEGLHRFSLGCASIQRCGEVRVHKIHKSSQKLGGLQGSSVQGWEALGGGECSISGWREKAQREESGMGQLVTGPQNCSSVWQWRQELCRMRKRCQDRVFGNPPPGSNLAHVISRRAALWGTVDLIRGRPLQGHMAPKGVQCVFEFISHAHACTFWREQLHTA